MTFWQLMYTEFKTLITDRAIVLTVFGGVLFYSVLYPLPYQNEVPTLQPLVVVDLDNSALSRQFIRHADATPELSVAAMVGSIDSGKLWIESGRARGMLVIPWGFKRDLILGKGVTLSYSGDASYFLVYSAVVEGLISTGMSESKGLQRLKLLSQGHGDAEADLLLNPITLNSIPVFNPSLGYTPYIVPGLFLLILHQTLLIGISILGAGQWRENGYWQQQSALKLVCARIGVFRLIYTLLGSFYLGFCFYWYQVSVLASLQQVMLLMLPYLLATAAAGVAFSTLFTRRDLPTQVLLLLSMPILFVSGFVWPIGLIPEPLVWVSQVLPAVPAIMAMLELNQMGGSWSSIMVQWLQLWAMFIVYFCLALYGVRKRLKPPT